MSPFRLQSAPHGRWWRPLLLRWALLLALLAVWELAPRLGLVDALLLPSPLQVLARGGALLLSGKLGSALLASLWRVMLGFGLAVVLALPLGIGLGLYPPLETLCAALLSVLRPLSPPAWIPLAILWFGIGDPPAVFIIFIGTFCTLVIGTLAATRSVDPQLIKTALTLGASRWQSVCFVVLPGLLPALLAQLRIGLGLAWMCVVAAEMVAVRRGIGFLMMEARDLFRTTDVLVGMITIGIVGFGADKLLLLVERRLCRWREGLDPAQCYGGQEAQP